MTNICNFDDVIDSRDVIARLEELNEKHTPWIAGTNMAGYMPDSDPSAFSTSKEARDHLIWELQQTEEQDETASIDDIKTMVADLDDNENDGQTFSETINGRCYWISYDFGSGLTSEEIDELKKLEALAKQGEGLEDWEHGLQLVRDTYFKDHAMELAEDLGMLQDRPQWPYTCIDWDKAARDLRMDYTPIEFHGVTYWAR